MNDERYILAQLKRRLLNGNTKTGSKMFYGYEVLMIVAELEAEAVLGEEPEEIHIVEEEVE